MTTLSSIFASVAPSTRRPTSGRHREVLILAFAVVAGSYALQIMGTDRVALWFAPNHPLPNVCMSRSWFGFDCPGCGLTRSFVSLAHGRWRTSLAFHPVGWVVALLVLVQFPYRIACLLGAKPLPALWANLIGWAVLSLLCASWIAKFV